jgi:RNA polymerase sigma factor (sigma-70 family)
MRACRDWKKVRQMDSPVAWVHTVGMNLARSHFRRRKVERRALERLTDQRPRASLAPEQAIELRKAVTALPPRQKEALVLRYFVDLRIDQVASAMHCSASTVKTLVRKGLDALRLADDEQLREAADAH